jgi:hypothetical protein
MSSVSLPFDWTRSASGDAVARVRAIYRLMAEGHSIKSAATIAAGEAPLAMIDWPSIADAFRTQKLEHGSTISLATWTKHYEPVVEMAVELLTSTQSPANPADLMDTCIRDWPAGSRSRQIRSQSLAQFLRYAVIRAGIPGLWAPPQDLKHHVGRSATAAARGSTGGDPFTDAQIINLITSLPEDAAGLRWRSALQLLAELGLRPIELQYLSIRTETASGEPYWWCSYRKRSGGGSTEPRRVHPLPLVDTEGNAQHWNLISRWKSNLIELPSLTGGNGAGDAIATYLNRQAGWRSLKGEMAAREQRAVPYSFRHSYSLRGHRRGIDAGSMAASMGHSYEVHCRAYAWASEASTVAAFQRANAALVG